MCHVLTVIRNNLRHRPPAHLIAQGRNNQAIADELVLSLKTVRNHVSNVFNKLQVTDRAGAISRLARPEWAAARRTELSRSHSPASAGPAGVLRARCRRREPGRDQRSHEGDELILSSLVPAAAVCRRAAFG